MHYSVVRRHEKSRVATGFFLKKGGKEDHKLLICVSVASSLYIQVACLEASSVRPIGKASSRLLRRAGTEVTTALRCSSGVELDLCISMSQLLKCIRMGKLIPTLEKAQRKLSSLAVQEQMESPPSLPVCLLALVYPSYKRRKFLPVHVTEARAIQYFLAGIKNVARSKPPSIRNPEKN